MTEQGATPATGEAATTRFRLRVAYDGTGFHGWTRQPGLRTVQGVLEDALGMLLRRHPPVPSLVVAGRTDAGVHALGQVAHVDLTDEQVAALSRERRTRSTASPGERLAARLNGILGLSSDVVLTAADLAPDGFDARFGAVWRRYEYRIADTPETRSPLDRHRTVWHPTALDADAMNAAARAMLGLHDFAAYCKPRAEATTIRTLQDYEWHRGGDGVLVARVQADAFCHSMVRALVGAAVAVGEGRLPIDRPQQLLGAGARSSEFIVMPARGLTLLEVGYPRDADLAARAEQTRARRQAHETASVVAPPAIG
ncbi:tRNA pseudouridine(38-40) synthase TruA [Naasia sp. SYSU D00057]|uniref:tRNA pseudouridine(38-40) synthase TruA n=1 Tax=Naasia sp. SYSU D00057 TaxID=2817380 RepID=UPI001B3046EB|nr:tRNA pseudouridine(38-40) synthase TruA [Naasia sp. SYSU D00057]